LTSTTLSAATADDVPALAGILVRCWRDAYRGVVADAILDRLDPGDEARRWGDLVAAHRVLVAREGDEPVGMVRYGADDEDPSRGHVFSLYVDPSAAGGGVGRVLLGRACEELAKAGFPRATLWVFAANERALRFYRASGWSPTERTRVEPEWRALELELARELGEP
jgi:ribosomal protein S18 acetylase RimI-like enzyme